MFMIESIEYLQTMDTMIISLSLSIIHACNTVACPAVPCRDELIQAAATRGTIVPTSGTLVHSPWPLPDLASVSFKWRNDSATPQNKNRAWRRRFTSGSTNWYNGTLNGYDMSYRFGSF